MHVRRQGDISCSRDYLKVNDERDKYMNNGRELDTTKPLPFPPRGSSGLSEKGHLLSGSWGGGALAIVFGELGNMILILGSSSRH